MDYEAIRESFRPTQIRILFVGESRPASGKFFYIGSPMTGYMAQAFSAVCKRPFKSDMEFLDFFKSECCYLDDLSHAPVDDLPSKQRKQILDAGVDQLAKRIREYNPNHVVAVLKSIESSVREAAERAEFKGAVDAVPFPGMSHQNKFVEELTVILRAIYES